MKIEVYDRLMRMLAFQSNPVLCREECQNETTNDCPTIQHRSSWVATDIQGFKGLPFSDRTACAYVLDPYPKSLDQTQSYYEKHRDERPHCWTRIRKYPVKGFHATAPVLVISGVPFIAVEVFDC